MAFDAHDMASLADVVQCIGYLVMNYGMMLVSSGHFCLSPLRTLLPLSGFHNLHACFYYIYLCLIILIKRERVVP